MIQQRWLTLSIIAVLLSLATMPVSRAQEEDLDQLFDEDLGNEPPPPPNFDQPPPPPPPDFNPEPPPGAGFQPQEAPPPSNMGGGGGISSSGSPTGTGKVEALTSKKGDLKERFSKAQIEDITSENFPETIKSFDFPNADIKDVIKAISELTGKNFIIDSGINGRVTIMAPSQITVAEAYKAFLSSLAGLGYTVVPSGKFLKIKSARNAQRDSIETYSGQYFPDADLLITRIVQLRHTSAEEINKRLRILPSKDGEMTPYEPTNSLIITDYGANVERIMKIIREIDRPGFEEQLAVVPIKYAKAKDMADLLNQIINKEPSSGGGGGVPGGFRAGVPRFRSRVGPGGPGSGQPEELSLVAPDDRTNAIIVLGTKAGIEKVRSLVRKLDFRLDPSEAGGVFVYYVKYGEAEKLATTLQGISGGGGSGGGGGASSGGGAFGGAGGMPSATRPFVPGGAQESVFGGSVKIGFDKISNSLIITAQKTDYDLVKNLLAKIDVPRDQVFVEAIIMEMNSNKTRDWNPAFYYLDSKSQGIGRAGFARSGTLSSILNPAGDNGAILSFGGGSSFEFDVGGGKKVQVKSLLSFVNFLQQTTESNILSTPQILALDNEQAIIEVGDRIPIGQATQVATGGTTTTAPQFEDATIKLDITPFISPDSDAVRMKLKQTVAQPSSQPVRAKSLQDISTAITKRTIETNIVVNDKDTAVLGGLVRDSEEITETKVPLLGDIPVIGWLFKASNKIKQKVNLLIFLTPKIIRSPEDNHNLLTKKANDRIEWLKNNFDGRDPYGKVIENLPRAAISEDAEPARSKQTD